MKTIKDVFAVFKRGLLRLYDTGEIEALTLMIISDISMVSKAQVKAFPEKNITQAQAEKFNNILQRLQTGEPVQYILGYTEFYGLPFKVSPAVLIPRPETEELVEWVLTSASNSKFAFGHILDVGTGSGCIAISLKKNLPNSQVSAIDISIDALDVAKQNSDLNNVKVSFIKADILNLKPQISDLKFDIIVSNPPYVTQDDKTQMHINVTDFEPHTALFVSEDDPLIFYNAIAGFAIQNLATSGVVFFEINEGLSKETIELLENKGFKNIELRKDMSGRDRMIKATLF